jgi:hypothetical protein
MNQVDYDRYMIVMSQGFANLQNATQQLKELYDAHEVHTGIDWPSKESIEGHREHLTLIAKMINEHIRMHSIEMENVKQAFAIQEHAKKIHHETQRQHRQRQEQEELFQKEQLERQREYEKLERLQKQREEAEAMREAEARREERQKQADEREAIRRNQKPSESKVPHKTTKEGSKSDFGKKAKTIEEFAAINCTGRRSCDCCDSR